MNSTIRRLAIAVPVIAAILGLSFTAAQAAPYEPSDHIAVQPAENDWPDDIVIADPADEPTDEPADEADDDLDDESDDESDEDPADEDSNDNGQPAPVQKSDDQGSNGQADTSDSGANSGADAEADVVETASSTDLAPSVTPAGVRVPLLMVIAAGALVAGIAGWAGYRRNQLLAH